MTKALENNDTMDVTKFVLAQVDVPLHSKAYPEVAILIWRLAVPLFIIISACWLFSKEKLLAPGEDLSGSCGSRRR